MKSSRLLFVAAVSACGFLAAAGCSDDSESNDTPGGGGSGNEANGGEAGTEEGGAAGEAGSAGAQTGSGGAQAGNGNGGSAGGSAGSAGSTAGSAGSTAGSGTGGSAGSSGKIVACTGTPTTCANISSVKDDQYYGCCAGNKVYWCDDQEGTWEIHSIDCASKGEECTYAPNFESMYCVQPPCTDNSTCASGEECINGVCKVPPCTATSCPTGQVCVNETCINDPGPGPGPGPGPTCTSLPPIQCTLGATECAKLVPFDPDNNPADAAYDSTLGYIDYPANGETWANQYRSFIRRDLMMLIKYATAFVACKATGWTSGNGKPLGLIDMSESNGAIPGTSIGSPGHPTGTHTNGRDIDVAYYQNGTADNKAREVCDHYTNGVEQYHCTATPHLLDVWRTALFIGALHSHPGLRVLGCDGKVGPMVVPAITKLCADGWLSGTACTKPKLAYEETNEGNGWFQFHHHHMHVSFTPPSYPASLQTAKQCLVPGCDSASMAQTYSRMKLLKD